MANEARSAQAREIAAEQARAVRTQLEEEWRNVMQQREDERRHRRDREIEQEQEIMSKAQYDLEAQLHALRDQRNAQAQELSAALAEQLRVKQEQARLQREKDMTPMPSPPKCKHRLYRCQRCHRALPPSRFSGMSNNNMIS